VSNYPCRFPQVENDLESQNVRRVAPARDDGDKKKPLPHSQSSLAPHHPSSRAGVGREAMLAKINHRTFLLPPHPL